MSKIIDNSTGEVIEMGEESKNEIVTRELMDVGIALDEYIELVVQSEYIKDQLEMWKFKNEPKIKRILERHNIKKYEGKYGEIDWVFRKGYYTLDREALKNSYDDKGVSIYERFKTKWVEPTDYILIKKKED